MARRAFAYTLTVSQVGPANDPDYQRAPAHVKDEVRRWIVVYGLKEKDADLAAGLDVKGKPLKPVKPKTADDRDSEMGPADPSAPALMPAYAVSRTRLLLEGEAVPAGAHFWWEYDPYTGDSWGRILDYHRKARTKRDVIGLSPAAVARVRDQVMRRWLGWKLAGLRPGWAPDRAPIPQLQDIVVRGGTDYDQYTYGIGGGDAATLRDALARRRATGFFQYEPGRGLTAYGGPRGIWEPPMPPPAPRPTPKPPKPPKPTPIGPAFRVHENTPAAFAEDARNAVNQLPPKVREALAQHGVEVVIGRRFRDVYPDLANQRPQGWPEGATLENLDGLYRPATKQVSAFSHALSLVHGDEVVSVRKVGTLHHEIGHAFDDALGQPSMYGRFWTAYEADVNALSDEDKVQLSYLLQSGVAGPSETFAEVFAQMQGVGALLRDVTKDFPRVVEFIRGLIE